MSWGGYRIPYKSSRIPGNIPPSSPDLFGSVVAKTVVRWLDTPTPDRRGFLLTFSSVSTASRTSPSPNGDLILTRIWSTVSSWIGRVLGVLCGLMSDVLNSLPDVVLGVFSGWRGAGELFVGTSAANMARSWSCRGRMEERSDLIRGGFPGSYPNRMAKVRMSRVGSPKYPIHRCARLP